MPTSSKGETAKPSHPRDWWVILGLAVSATAAMISSFSGLTALARVTGWGWMSPLLPATVDALAATATRLWVSPALESPRVRRLSRACALGAIFLSLAGNACYHLIAAGLIRVTWPVVLAVGAVPALVLGLVSHMAALRRASAPLSNRRDTDAAARSAVPKTVFPESGLPPDSPAPEPVVPAAVPRSRAARTETRTEAELLAAARAADAAHRAAHGKGISRDALRAELRVAGARASHLLRQLRAEDTDQPDAASEKGGRRP